MLQRFYKEQDHREIARSLVHMGWNLGELGSHQEALAYKKQALEMSQRLYQGQDHPENAKSLNNVGWSLGELGSHQEALAYKKQALEMSQRLYQEQGSSIQCSIFEQFGGQSRRIRQPPGGFSLS